MRTVVGGGLPFAKAQGRQPAARSARLKPGGYDNLKSALISLRPLRRLRRLAAVLVLAVGTWVGTAGPSAQTVSAPILTAAFLIKFAKFAEWPADALAADAPLVVCTNDPDVAEALPAAVGGRLVGGRRVVTIRVAIDPAPRHCGVLYAGGLDERRAGSLATGLRGASVLSVSDSEVFTKRGGIIHLFISGDDGTMRFAVNVAAAERARLTLSSSLLRIALIIKE